MTGHDAKTILVHGDITVLAGDNETMEKAKSLPCESLNQAPATILFLMTKCTMATFLFLMTESTIHNTAGHRHHSTCQSLAQG